MNLEQNHLTKEWLETNNLGTYSSTSISGCHTRKYHGLLVVPGEHGAYKNILLSKIATEIHAGDSHYNLDINKFPQCFYPHGDRYLTTFNQTLFPSQVYTLGDGTLNLSYLLLKSENTLLIRYTATGFEGPVTIKLSPFIAYRCTHDLTFENPSFRGQTTMKSRRDGLISPYSDMPPLFFGANKEFDFKQEPHWIKSVEYPMEQQRQFPYAEDLFCPGHMEHKLQSNKPLYLHFSTTRQTEVSHSKLWHLEVERRRKEWMKTPGKDNKQRQFIYDAGKFIKSQSKECPSITAGFPWFEEWGRDTMISTPGLTLYRKKPRLCLKILENYGRLIKNGLLPNTLGLGRDSSPHYNSIDASLWYLWAAQQYLYFTGQRLTFAKNILPYVTSIIEAFLNNDVPLAHLDDDGLIYAGNERTQLTWMDATVDGKPVTARYGKAVEINALWYNGLGLLLDASQRRRGPKPQFQFTEKVETLMGKIPDSFQSVFWNSQKNYCADVVNEEGQDMRFRPNQLFAVGLPYSPLSETQQKSVVTQSTKWLLTPYGIRTLSPCDPAYRPTYTGSPNERDKSYHQGTAWPWLIGIFCESYLKVATDKKEAAGFLRSNFSPLFKDHIENFGISSIAEIFDGSPPHHPRGCYAQAWSVAEVIRSEWLLEKAVVA